MLKFLPTNFLGRNRKFVATDKRLFYCFRRLQKPLLIVKYFLSYLKYNSDFSIIVIYINLSH